MASDIEPAKVMMVDDEPTTLDMLQMFLQADGYRSFVSTTDSRQALDLLAQERPDVLLLNLMMPNVGGLDILRSMRAEAELRTIPVIILTSSTDAEVRHRALKLGVTDFLAKPVDPIELALRLRNTLESAAYRGERADNGASPGEATLGPPVVSRLPQDSPRVQAVIEKFVSRLHEKLAAMELSYEAGDLVELAALAHWLRGTAGTVGFDAFTEPAQALRLLAMEGKLAEMEGVIQELRTLAERIVV